MSNRCELSSRNFAAVDSPNVSSEAQAIVDKYLQSQKDLADKAKKNIQIVKVQGNESTIQCRMEKVRQITSRIQGKWTTTQQWKCRWLGKIQCTGILNENVTKKKWKWPGKMQRTGIFRKKKMTRKDATYRDLVKIFKSWQVCDWLAKWIIMLRFINLSWPRVFRRFNVGLVGTSC